MKSGIYRYKLAQKRHQNMIYRLVAQRGDEACLRNEANRDIMRFIEILNEAIGERD